MLYGLTQASEAKAKLPYVWPCHNRTQRVGSSTTHPDLTNQSPIVDEAGRDSNWQHIAITLKTRSMGAMAWLQQLFL